MLRLALCCMWLLAAFLWSPLAVWAQGTVWTNAVCRARMNDWFEEAKKSLDEKALKDKLTDKVFQHNCGSREALSIQMADNRLKGIETQKKELGISGAHLEKAANAYSQSPAYDPGGMPGRQ